MNQKEFIDKPKTWRTGQTVFNFLEWLTTQGYATNQSNRMADPFYIPDDEWDKLYKQFLKEQS